MCIRDSSLIVDEHFAFSPRLGRIAERTLQQGKLERLDEAIKQLVQNASRPLEEDSLWMVACMVSEQTVWGVIAELRDLMLDIVTGKCDSSLLEQVADTFNPNLITQMVSKGAFTAQQFISTLDSVQALIEEAAPICVLRLDYWYSPIRRQLQSGQMGAAEDFPFLVMELIETLQELKLELANWRLALLRPSIVQTGIEWEVCETASRMQAERPLPDTIETIQSAREVLEEEKTPLTCINIHTQLMLQLITSTSAIPEPFALDASRILHWRDQLSTISLACALWTVGRACLLAHEVEITPAILIEIRCSMFASGCFSAGEHRAWALTFCQWMNAAALRQGKHIPLINDSGCRVSSQFIAAAEPEGPLRQLLSKRLVKILRVRQGFGAAVALSQQERLQFSECFALAASELSDVLDDASATAVHLGRLYLPMYVPFVKGDVPALRSVVQFEPQQIVVAEDEFEDDDEDDRDEEEQLEQPGPFQLSMPGLQPLSYVRSSVKRSSSCNSLVGIQRQSSCGEELTCPPMTERKNTVDLVDNP
eukprot:TRINITY_DN5614_c0_g1_i1.p1 TRINITY_DN5614_c0_g1~~TRINITY_DN5614_c0_g1_i1.p1  ORF type:complete len:538 (+),score=99.43 TRINITY_DN5614_c0_g1_i1:151-1764(+)